MKRSLILPIFLIALSGLPAALGDDAPEGEVTKSTFDKSKLFPGIATTAPPVLDADGKASVVADGIARDDLVVRHDGGGFHAREPGSGGQPSRIRFVAIGGERKVETGALKYSNGVELSPDRAFCGLVRSVLVSVQAPGEGQDAPRAGAPKDGGKGKEEASKAAAANESKDEGEGRGHEGVLPARARSEPVIDRSERQLGIDLGLHNDVLHNFRLFNTRVAMTKGVNPGVRILLATEYKRYEDRRDNWMGDHPDPSNHPRQTMQDLKKFVQEIIGSSVRMDYLPRPPSAAILNAKVAEFFVKQDMNAHPDRYFGESGAKLLSAGQKSPDEEIRSYREAIEEIEKIRMAPKKTKQTIYSLLSQVPLYAPFTMEDGTVITQVTIPMDLKRAVVLVTEVLDTRKRAYEGVIAMMERDKKIKEVTAKLEAEAAAAIEARRKK